MTENCFDSLCEKIISVVGEDEFKSENYLETFMFVEQPNLINIDQKRRIFYAHNVGSGGYICGEVKLAITFRITAGGSYFDVAALYCCGYTHAYEIFHETIQNWINNDEIIKFKGLNYFEDIEEMKKTSRDFQQTGCHGGIINYSAGHIASYYSRKGFYAVNVQAIVNKDKVVLWRSIMCKASEHDSTAFKKTQLHEKLLASFTNLVNHGLYIVGDSAYTIRSFLLVSLDNARL